jgi:hypothetical protein
MPGFVLGAVPAFRFNLLCSIAFRHKRIFTAIRARAFRFPLTDLLNFPIFNPK